MEISIYKVFESGIEKYIIQYEMDDILNYEIFYNHNWNRSIIIDKLIRSQYPQDKVEAIINNHFLNIAEWLDKKFMGEDVTFVDKDYDDLQAWRKRCKEIADEALEKYPEIN